MKYVFDIDGTICSNTDGNYEHAEPILERIKKINELYSKGHKIMFMTARGMGRYKNNRSRAHEEFYDFTLNQLKKWGVKFHELYLGKPEADFFIDDKGQWSEMFFDNKKNLIDDVFDEK